MRLRPQSIGKKTAIQIRDKLKENENDLVKGVESLRKTLKKLANIKKALDMAAAFVDLVARVATLVA